MRISSRAILALLVFCGCTATARAAGPGDAIEAGMSWHLGFGGKTLETGYGLTLGYRSSEHFAPLSRLIQFNANRDLASVTVAGLPLVSRADQANQAQAAEVVSDRPTTPWYAHSWILWTVGGIAATAALVSSAGGSGEQQGCQQNGGCGVACANSTCAVSASRVDGSDENGLACVDGNCTVPCKDANKPAGCVPYTGVGAAGYAMEVARDVRPDDLTGGMGDLVAQ